MRLQGDVQISNIVWFSENDQRDTILCSSGNDRRDTILCFSGNERVLMEEIPFCVSVEMEVNQGKLMNEVIENRREFSVVSVSSVQSL